MEIRTATARDAGALSALDKHISADALRESLAGARVLVLCDGEEISGWLRWSLFWDEIPFLNMLYLLEPHRGHGHGRALVEAWEERMRHAGHAAVLTSTQVNEFAQHFYRHLGYADIGAFALPGDPLELVLYKAL